MNGAGAKAGAIAVDAVEGASVAPPAMAAEVALGARLGSYSFDKYHTKKKDEDKKSLGELSVMLDEPGAAEDAFEANASLADGVFAARDLVSEPSNVKYPRTIADDIEALNEDGIEVELLDRDKMAALGMGSLLGVAQGSEHEPYLAVMHWNGAPDGAEQQPVAFIGKGVTFDTGGISIKPSQGMEEMKYDMAGSATVVGLMKCLAGRKARVNAIGVVGLVENMPDGKAQRPGDVVTSMSGQTIEVINTDAEGRLVLADVLWYTQATYKPRFMVDLATLTGAILISLGTYQAGLFSNDDELAERLIAAGKESGEELWRMPLGERYDKDIDSAIADMKNVGKGREAGSTAGAVFLQRFRQRRALGPSRHRGHGLDEGQPRPDRAQGRLGLRRPAARSAGARALRGLTPERWSRSPSTSFAARRWRRRSPSYWRRCWRAGAAPWCSPAPRSARRR